MKTLNLKSGSLAIIGLIALVPFSCEEPDESGPDDRWCTSGINVQVVDDSMVPAEAKTMIYSMPEGYNGIGDPDYDAEKKVIFIPFEFATEYPRNTNVTTDLIRHDIFGVGTGSARDYFNENSYGQFELVEGVITDWVTLSKDPAEYMAGYPDWPSSHELHEELCQRANVNWWDFDENGDHIIDLKDVAICFMASVGQRGCNRASTFTLMTNFGEYVISEAFIFFDCKQSNQADSHIDPIVYNLPTAWHEMCHGIFGLPDRYSDFCGSGTTGQFDIMSDNCSRRMMNMFDKMKLGWVKPRILENAVYRPDGDRHCYGFPASANTPAALVLYDRDRTDQYWVVENRYKPASALDFDQNLPESGLAVWWIEVANNNRVYLVNAKDPMKHPQTISYTAGSDATGTLFYGDAASTDETIYTTYFSSNSGDLSFLVRAVSPPGDIMYIEF